MKACEQSIAGIKDVPVQPTLVEKKLLRTLRKKINNQQGTLHLTLPSGYTCDIGNQQPEARLKLHNFRPLIRMFFGGINGWSESYLAGEWDSDDLTTLVQWAILNEGPLEQLSKARAFTRTLHNLYHWRHDNTRTGSKKNISAHYDLGNNFYKHWLDESMTYSSALYQHPNEPLHLAQKRKNNRIIELLNAQPGDHVIEIGCGWGGFAIQASKEHDLKVHGITLSSEQLKWAQNEVTSTPLSNQVHFSLTDYRDLYTQYDAVVSIEMFEAVGETHWDTYFETLKRILKPGGHAVLQIITIDDDRFQHYRKQADFIQRYVFPGGMLPSVPVFKNKLSEHGFVLKKHQCFGKDYARTLREWSHRFEHAWEDIKGQGFDETFYRLWRYYLAYCEGGFEQGSIDVGLYVLAHADE